jgi:hypothetical protein
MSDSRNPHAGLEALLAPQDSVLLLIDHQPFQFANLHSHEPTLVVNNVVGARQDRQSVPDTDHPDHGSRRTRRAVDQGRSGRVSRSKADQSQPWINRAGLIHFRTVPVCRGNM